MILDLVEPLEWTVHDTFVQGATYKTEPTLTGFDLAVAGAEITLQATVF